MIISDKNKFVFIKGHKVGGTSLEIALAAICGDEDIITPITPIDERLRYETCGRMAQNFGITEAGYSQYQKMISSESEKKWIGAKSPRGIYYNHMPYREIVKYYGMIPKEYKVFSIERSPYYKIISLANWSLKADYYRKFGNNVESSGKMVADRIENLIKNKKIRVVHNIDKYKDRNGNIVCEIMRYENIADEYKNLMQDLLVADVPALPHAKKGLLSESRNIDEFIRRDQINIINEMFHEEFEKFSYSMY